MAKAAHNSASVDAGRSRSESISLTREVLQLGETALLSCQEMKRSAVTLIEDNRDLMKHNHRIKGGLALEKHGRNSIVPNR